MKYLLFLFGYLLNIVFIFNTSIFAQKISNESKYSYSNTTTTSIAFQKQLQAISSCYLPSDLPIITTTPNNPTSGYYFLDIMTISLDDMLAKFVMIIDNDGNPVFYKRVPNNTADFKLQPNGLITYYDFIERKFYGMDSTFAVVDSFYAQNGYNTDCHELKFLPNGHFLLIADDSVMYDMSKYVENDYNYAMVVNNVIQEQDANHNVVFQWNSFDHFKFTDATDDIDLKANEIDYEHMNAIEPDLDGNLLISSRNMDEITKINRQTGEIMWRWGGKNNQFKCINEPYGFSHQHAISRLPNGNLLLFDDGNLHWSDIPSRGIEFRMNETDKTVEMVWEYLHDPPIKAAIMGNVQVLDNGNRLIGWGSGAPAMTEIDNAYQVVNEVHLPAGVMNYRAVKAELPDGFYSAFIPNLVEPANGIVLKSDTVSLSWSKNALAQSFQIQIARDSDFTNVIANVSGLVEPKYLFKFNSNLRKSSNEFYWRVISCNNGNDIGGLSAWSDVRTFTIQNDNHVSSICDLPLDLPPILTKPKNTDNGLYFLDIMTLSIYDTNSKFVMVVDNDGNPVFYKRVPNNTADFRLQPNGLITYYDFLSRKFYGMDSTFAVVDSFYAQNGYNTDCHELKFLPNGHFLLIGDDSVMMDMSKYVPNNDKIAQVVGNVIQEQDANHKVVFEWNSLDHFQITDAARDIELFGDIVDYTHMNAVEPDLDGNLLISSRNLDEITKIDRQTGNIIWRWGGKNNQFVSLNDSIGFSHQHAILRLDNGNLLMFDDGNLHWDIAPSRGVEFKMDEKNKTVELVWEYQHNPPIKAAIMGNVQLLDNGNRLIGWGSGIPAMTEVDNKNNLVNEVTLPTGEMNYRAKKFLLPSGFYSSLIPSPVYPQNNSKLTVDSIDIRWTKNKLAQSFILQISSDPEFNNLVVDDSAIAENHHTVTLFSNAGNPDLKYYWRVMSCNNTEDIGGVSKWSEVYTFDIVNATGISELDINQTGLGQCYPNPVSNSTTINYFIKDDNYVKLSVFNSLGNEILQLVNNYQSAGSYKVDLNTEDLPAGAYFYRLSTGGFSSTKNMTIIK